ncbi:MAG: DUF58 domain-containing protein [Armatimonadota bacterium]|nr:DUF58 domain-containing protein [Armatimonadota bacterium]MDR5702587.1 DUF58 domain-containing protein [Armatimonadota bacterium]
MPEGALLLDQDFLRRLDMLSLRLRRPIRGFLRGERRSRTVGGGMEFSDYRSYQVGDDFRYIDWNVYSRLDRLFVKLFHVEEEMDMFLLLDTSQSMSFGSPSKLEYAKKVAAALGYIGLSGFDRVVAVGATDHLHGTLPALQGKAGIPRLFRFLASLDAGGPTSLSRAFEELLLRARRRGFILLLSDLLDPSGSTEPLKRARYRGFELAICHILDEEDLFPSLEGDVQLVDCERGDRVDVSLNSLAWDQFIRARDAYLRELEEFCLRHQIVYVRATTAVPFEDLVLRYLRLAGVIT